MQSKEIADWNYQYSNLICYVVELNAEPKVNKQVEVHEYTYIILTSLLHRWWQCYTYLVCENANKGDSVSK